MLAVLAEKPPASAAVAAAIKPWRISAELAAE
jgi:hypothetical protein